ncbi:PREDICTED: sensory neuron membrane protein 2-like isoform X3 [Papilio polytes]|uniref:sensory neuron membrane protein 2-like isoform X3 n=1 Tax=Papilio polytes TaxID=76194 RepID=UPI0006762495|nr:PREDICTED: sensory neuron membrane protein 2-like isoform X3 [Papilio polytes]
MCGIICGVTTTIIGVVLVVVSTVLTFVFVPGVIEDLIINEVVLLDDTEQMERFQEIPFPLNFTVRFFNISNRDEVLAGGVPDLIEVGPYVYKSYQSRVVESKEDDTISYRALERLEFDAESSYPYTEDDIVTIVNVPYHLILQVAEKSFPNLMSIINSAITGVFGRYNSPITDVRVRDLLLDGIKFCENPGLIAGIVCTQIRSIGATSNNLVVQDDGSIIFALLTSRIQPSSLYKVHRGINNPEDLGRTISLNGSSQFHYWIDEEEGKPSVCNMINGTDASIYNPFVDNTKSLFGINTDICRSVELRYQHDTDYEGIPAYRFSANEWFLDNDDGCFCLNATSGITREDGCLLRGAAELYSCVGGPMVLSYPHFLYADPIYANGVKGLNPSIEDHRILLDLEPTGTVLRGAKRAQFNIFLRPITSVTATANFNNTLTPIVWLQESVLLPEEFVNQLKDRMLMPLNLVSILLPIVIALCCVVVVVGVVIFVRAKLRNKSPTITNTR